MRHRRIALSERIEFVLSALFIIIFALATSLVYQGSRRELDAKRSAVLKEFGESLELTNNGLVFLLNPDVIPALVRSRDPGRVENVLRRFLDEGAELSAVVVMTGDWKPFAAVSPAGAFKAGRALHEFAGRPAGEAEGFSFVPAGASAPEALIIRHPIVESGRVGGFLLAEADLGRILRRISAAHAYPLSVRLAGLSVEQGHPRPVLEAPILPRDVFFDVARYRLGIVLLVLSAIAVLYVLCRLLVRKMIFPFELLVMKLDSAIKGDRAPIEEREYPAWFRPFLGRINSLIVSVIETQERERRAMASQALQETASQVAHDIRSPLAALEVAAGDGSRLPEDKRILIRAAVGRIRDIANSLLSKQGAHAAGFAPAAPEAASPRLLSSLIDSVVSEKRLQFRSLTLVGIELRLDASSYGLFAAVQPVEFKRLISNLVNNAVEAFAGGAGAVSVGLTSRDGRARVTVQDDGKGIPTEVLPRLGRRGETHGKTAGSGLGLYHARACAESWGGSLELASEVGKGTTATVVLPLAPEPEWFVSELRLTPGKAVVILDDDASIHRVWQGRLDSLKAGERGVPIVHVSSPDALRSWVKDEKAAALQALCLFDYELQGYCETGLSLAEELALGERVVLVTSRFEEPEVLESCRKLKARLIPKGLAGLVPMRVEADAPTETSGRERLDAALIDDDALMRMTWNVTASRLGKKLRVFATAAEFFKAAGEIDCATPVYVDAELGDGVKGDVESLRIRELGFGEIYLVTGHEPEKFAGSRHLRGVIGKEPPWGGG